MFEAGGDNNHYSPQKEGYDDRWIDDYTIPKRKLSELQYYYWLALSMLINSREE